MPAARWAGWPPAVATTVKLLRSCGLENLRAWPASAVSGVRRAGLAGCAWIVPGTFAPAHAVKVVAAAIAVSQVRKAFKPEILSVRPSHTRGVACVSAGPLL